MLSDQSSTQRKSPVNNPPRRPRSTLECPICLSLMTDPVVACCGHSFCTPCITTYLGYADKRRRDAVNLRPSPRNTPKPCPVCETTLSDGSVYPNIALASLVDRARARGTHSTENAPPTVDVRSLPDDQADRLLTDLLRRKRAARAARASIGVDIAIPFLEKCRVENRHSLEAIKHDLQLIESDLRTLRDRKPSHNPHHQPDLDAAGVVPPDIIARNNLVSQYHNDVKSAYFENRRRQGDQALITLMDMLVDATSVSSVRKHASIQHIDILRSNHNLISSIEFNSDATIFATAGVTKRIKVFEFHTLINSSRSDNTSRHHYPILEIPTPSKLSCLSWSRARSSILAASTYKGNILIHDTETNTQLEPLQGHSKRAWYVDFSSMKPSLLLSGSDDNTVRLWDVDRQGASAMTLQTTANVCCVKFNPYESNEFAFGSADHNVYSYDLRHPKTPLCVFEGHWRAVSHVLFLNRSELVSASTDSSCKLWNVEKQEPGLSYAGHSNDRNFVGLSGSQDFFACGSEDNAVYFYHKGFAGPVAKYSFGSGGGFVSTVAWKPYSPWVVAATNSGSIEILELL